MNTNPIVLEGVRYYTIQQVMAIFHVSKRTVYNWMDGGVVRFGIGPSGRRYIFADDLAIKEDTVAP